jgi:preprotein translocase subunit SecA
MRAALAMHEGLLVQMAAGEGKTLAVALAGVLHGWRGLPCHVVTANDYLAQRDAQLMGPLYRRCGASVAAVVHGLEPQALQQAYACDVVYATSKQLLADHLFDQISLEGATDAVRRRVRGLGEGSVAVRSRGLYAAIVDEADSVLIDEANTPLIISAPQPNPLLVSAVLAARDVAEELQAGRDYRVDLKFRDIEFTEEGQTRVEALTQRLPPVWHAPERRDDLVKQALSARELYLRDRQYIVQDGKIEILDENTGRVMPGRSWSYGLHQAIEAREGVQITHPSRTMARMSFQEFFRHYHLLGGASGTLQGVRQELWWTYGLLTLAVPTRLPSRLQVPAPRHHADAQAKWAALLAQVQALHRQGHPVLVGTRRLSDSETLQQRLAERGLPCAVLNAKQHAHEAAVVAAAGQPGSITVATNMAGRGTDIHLPAQVAGRGGLHVLMLEPHESVRVDWQLYGRAGRQGQPGHAQAFVALDDDLLKRHLPFWLAPLRALMARSPAWRGALIGPLVVWCQRRAQARAFLQRRYLQQRERELRKQLSFSSTGVG